jgi:hypothetical protein
MVMAFQKSCWIDRKMVLGRVVATVAQLFPVHDRRASVSCKEPFILFRSFRFFNKKFQYTLSISRGQHLPTECCGQCLAVFEQIFGYFLRVIMNLMKSILYISRNQRLKGNGGTFPQVKWKKNFFLDNCP